MKSLSKEKKHTLCLLGLSFLFYLLFALIFPIFTDNDTVSYVNMSSTREPVYSLFLWIFRSIFGTDIYMRVVVIIQNLLMAFAVFKICSYAQKKLFLPIWSSYVFLGIHFMVAIMNQFLAGRSAAYPNSIITEGITLSLFLLFIHATMEAMLTQSLKYVLFATLYAALLMDTRKQMLICFIILFGALFFGWMKQKEYFKKMGLSLLIMAGGLLLAMGGTKLYNYALRGEFSGSTRNMNLVLTTSLYICDREDVSLIEEEAIQDLFLETFDTLDAKELNISYAEDGWSGLAYHYTISFDQITCDVTEKTFVENAIERGFEEGMKAEEEADRMSSVIVSSLLKDNLSKYIRIYFASFMEGLINTVAKRHPILDLYSIFAYILYLALTVKMMIKKETRIIGLSSLLVLLSILVNIGVTAALIFCQTRYMIYNMALFYMMLFAMLLHLFKKSSSPVEQTNSPL